MAETYSLTQCSLLGGSVNLYVSWSSIPTAYQSHLLHQSMHGVMGIANAQRTLTYLRIIAQFVSQDQYRDVVGMWALQLLFSSCFFTVYSGFSVGIVNEILWATVGEIPVQSFYFAAYEAIRKSTYAVFLPNMHFSDSSHRRGTGPGAGPYIAIHEGFQGVWNLPCYV